MKSLRKNQIRGKSIWLAVVFLAGLAGCNTINRTDIHYLISAGALPYLKPSKVIQVSSFDTSGGNKDYITIEAGKKVTIFDAEGPGMIVRMWFSIDSPDPYFLRRIVLRIYWENETRPAVEVPIGDFFGSGFAYAPYVSQYLGMSGGGYVCYFPMPFERQARVEIVNETRQDISGFYYQINYHKFEGALQSEVAYFHANWQRSIKTDFDSNYVLMKTVGKGHVVGVNLNIQSCDGTFSFLEGDEMVYVDGEKKPSLRGTGIEDFFSAGRNFEHGLYHGNYQGLIYKDDSLKRISAYRLFVLDPVSYRKSILFTIEHGHANQAVADISSTVYWYQMDAFSDPREFKKAGLRIPLRIVKPLQMTEAENLKFSLGGLNYKLEDMSEEGADWSGNKQMVIEAEDKSTFDFVFTGLEPKEYQFDIYFTLSPGYGNADIFVNGKKSGQLQGYSPFIEPDGKITVTGNPTTTGSVVMRFMINGKDTLSGGYVVGLDGIHFYASGEIKNPQPH